MPGLSLHGSDDEAAGTGARRPHEATLLRRLSRHPTFMQNVDKWDYLQKIVPHCVIRAGAVSVTLK